MKQLKRWQLDANNVKMYDRIWHNQGNLYTTDAQSYVELLQKYNIKFSINYAKLPILA